MTPRTFCASGSNEFEKGACHAAAAMLMGAMTVYNGIAWGYRRERHLLFNTCVYGAMTALEIKQITRHWTTPCTPQ